MKGNEKGERNIFKYFMSEKSYIRIFFPLLSFNWQYCKIKPGCSKAESFSSETK